MASMTEQGGSTDTYSWALAATGLSYAVLHHLGLLPDGLGAGPEGTRCSWASAPRSWFSSVSWCAR